MQEAMTRLAERLAGDGADDQGSIGETVTYTRALDGWSAPVTALVGRRRPSRAAVAAGLVEFDKEPKDFVIRVADLAAIGVTEPVRGDRLTISSGEVYEAGPRDGEPVFTRIDADQAFRIRTMLESRPV